MHLIVVDAQWFLKMPLSSLAGIFVVVVVYIYACTKENPLQIKTLFRPNAFRLLPSSGVFTLGSLIH